MFTHTLASLLALALDSGGFSLNPHTGEPAEGGFFVSLPGFESKFDLALLDFDVRFWNAELQNLLETARDIPGAFLGGWVSDGHLVFDISLQVASLKTALACGRAWGQDAVWDNETFTEHSC